MATVINPIQEESARKEGEIIDEYIKIIERILSKVNPDGLKCSENDYYQIFLLVFSKRFKKHYDSIKALRNISRDCMLVARSMLEGLAIMRWVVGTDKDSGAQSYRAKKYLEMYLVVLMQRLQAQGDRARAEHIDVTRQAITKTQDLLTPEDYNDLSAGEELSNETFIKLVTGFSTYRDLFVSIGVEEVYKRTYSWFSGYHHWSSFHIGYSVKQNGDVEIDEYSDHEYSLSLLISFLALSDSVIHLTDSFSLANELKERFHTVTANHGKTIAEI